MKTTHEIIKPCIEYKQIEFTSHWCENKNKRWWSEKELREIIESLTLDNPTSLKKGYIEAELLKRFLFEENAPDLNLRRF